MFNKINHVENQIGIVNLKVNRIENVENQIGIVNLKVNRIENVENQIGIINLKVNHIENVENQINNNLSIISFQLKKVLEKINNNKFLVDAYTQTNEGEIDEDELDDPTYNNNFA